MLDMVKLLLMSCIRLWVVSTQSSCMPDSLKYYELRSIMSCLENALHGSRSHTKHDIAVESADGISARVSHLLAVRRMSLKSSYCRASTNRASLLAKLHPLRHRLASVTPVNLRPPSAALRRLSLHCLSHLQDRTGSAQHAKEMPRTTGLLLKAQHWRTRQASLQESDVTLCLSSRAVPPMQHANWHQVLTKGK